MEDNNKLSDIVLEKDDGKILKTKRVLIIVAILIILFLVVILSMKLFNSPSNNKTTNLVLPPEPISSMQKTKKDEELFKQVPIIEENKTKKDNFENIVKNLKAKETRIAQKETQNSSKVKTKTSMQPVVKEIVKSKKKTLEKRKEKKVKQKVKTTASKGIYIQIGATTKHSPNKNFLKKIANQKLKYKLLPVVVKGKKVMKILVGPFETRAIAKQNLPKVKKYLNKNAFIYSVR